MCGEIERLRDQVLEGQRYLCSLSIDQIIGWLGAAAQLWEDRHHPLQQRYGRQGLNFLLQWLRPSHLQAVCDTALRGSRLALDQFVTTSAGRVACFPRGVVCHWIAGNVPTLGFLSLLLGLLTKNGNIVKLPSSGAELTRDLVQALAQASSCGVEGGRVAASIATLSLDRADRVAQEELSLAADVRVAWGGAEAIEAIATLPRRPGSEELLFGPRTSFALIGREKLTREGVAKRARAVVRDATLFDQKGCNAPHTLFLERGGEVAPLEFARLLAAEMEQQCSLLPEPAIAAGEVGLLLARRAEYAMCAEAFHSKGVGWSVLYTEERRRLEEPLGYRTLFLQPLDDLFECLPLCSRTVQSVGLALSPARYEECAYRLMKQGVDRCPRLGGMGQFELPWDGLYILDRLVRWSRLDSSL